MESLLSVRKFKNLKEVLRVNELGIGFIGFELVKLVRRVDLFTSHYLWLVNQCTTRALART